MITDIEKLDALGREHGHRIYSLHQRDERWCMQWLEDGKDHVVYQFYPNVAELLKGETARLGALREQREGLGPAPKIRW